MAGSWFSGHLDKLRLWLITQGHIAILLARGLLRTSVFPPHFTRCFHRKDVHRSAEILSQCKFRRHWSEYSKPQWSPLCQLFRGNVAIVRVSELAVVLLPNAHSISKTCVVPQYNSSVPLLTYVQQWIRIMHGTVCYA